MGAIDGSPQTRKGKVRSTRARLNDDPAIMLRLRLGFGVGVKADLITYLLARVHEWATVREISEATAYAPAAVRRAAEDLAAARLVESLERQPASYRITYGPWRTLLALEERPPRWASWQERFVFTTAFPHWVDTASARPPSVSVAWHSPSTPRVALGDPQHVAGSRLLGEPDHALHAHRRGERIQHPADREPPIHDENQIGEL